MRLIAVGAAATLLCIAPSLRAQYGPSPTTQPSPTEQKLREAELKDSGRGLEVFAVMPEVGAAFARSATGVQVGLALHGRFLYLTGGVRSRVAFFEGAKVFQVGPELGFHVPLGNVEPFAVLGINYARATGSLSGHSVRGGGGVDYYLTPNFSVGGLLTAERLNLGSSSFVLSMSAVAGLHLLAHRHEPGLAARFLARKRSSAL